VPSGLPNNNSEAPRRFRQTLDQREIEDLAEAYKAGTPINNLAAQFGIDRSAILKHLKAMDIPRRHPALDPEQCVEVCRFYEGGLPSTEIGQIFNVSGDTVLSWPMSRQHYFLPPTGTSRRPLATRPSNV
jgi:hypothetical protein